jgi:Tol biopolymer transport system component
MTDRQLEERLRAWYATEVAESETAPADLRESITAIPDTTPTPLRPLTRRRNIALLAVAAVLVVGGAIAAGSGLMRLTAVVPPVPPLPSQAAEFMTPAPTPSATVVPEPTPGVVAYTVREGGPPGDGMAPSRIWLVNADGSGAHEFLADVPGDQEILGWSPDGSRLLYLVPRGGGIEHAADVFATDAAGSVPELICAADAGQCPDVGSLSPDGSRLAYVITEGPRATAISTIAILDLSTMQVTKLDSTRTTGARLCDSAARDRLSTPGWSPDGTRLVFAREGIIGKTRDGACRASTVLVVNVDGSGLLEITSPDMLAYGPSWSPDGARIVFDGDERKPTTALWATDLYTIRPDGTDMRRLTTDGLTGWAGWTRNGQIVFGHSLSGGFFAGVRLMNTDGTGDVQIDENTVADLTAVGCTICPYAPAGPGAAAGGGPRLAYWQPTP